MYLSSEGTGKFVHLCRYISDLAASLFVCFVALHPKSTAMVMEGQSVHLTKHFFLGKLEQAVNPYFVHILSLETENDCRNYFMINLHETMVPGPD